MKPWMPAIALALLSAGCTTVSLERNTIRQAESLSDLRYREVMENLAMIAHNPDVLPSYSSIYAGTTDVSDTAGATSDSFWTRGFVNKTAFTSTIFSQDADFSASRVLKQNWTLDPVVAPEKLTAMRIACWWAIFGRDSLSPECLRLLGEYKPHDPAGYYFNVAKDLEKLHDGWLHRGGRACLPRNACYQAHCHGTYVWVDSDGMEDLSILSRVLQHISRSIVDQNYYPVPHTLTYIDWDKDTLKPEVTKIRIQGKKFEITRMTSEVTLRIDADGFAGPFKSRLENVGNDPKLRSQIGAAKSP